MVLQILLPHQGPLNSECQAPSDPRHSLETSISPTGIEAVHSADGSLAVEQFRTVTPRGFLNLGIW